MVYAIIQARMNSSRLPGKVLLNICGIPELIHVARRVWKAERIDSIILATTDSKADDAIEQCCKENNIQVFRGSENDVLDRYLKAAEMAGANEDDYIVRVTADCPLIDPDIIDNAIGVILTGNYDYVSNTLKPTFPDGLDVEVFSFRALRIAWQSAKLQSEREHVTPYIYKHPELFNTHNIQNETDYSQMRWTLDEKADFKVISKIYNELYEENSIFKTEDILSLRDRKPEIFIHNMGFKRNEGYTKSLEQE